jgi:hypothetical protein
VVKQERRTSLWFSQAVNGVSKGETEEMLPLVLGSTWLPLAFWVGARKSVTSHALPKFLMAAITAIAAVCLVLLPLGSGLDNGLGLRPQMGYSSWNGACVPAESVWVRGEHRYPHRGTAQRSLTQAHWQIVSRT